ncbi:hypothetical protein NDU88_008674 [Pleurodeles waltl]|uniref:Uncharacterized protein n=1 Tax=Pleurodeles waltl TaxID=8319 RepID=A0AAV7N5L5_PLEWA|nr:hypothetical protein NDU88_008674 [Pleurodeles waltl]
MSPGSAPEVGRCWCGNCGLGDTATALVASAGPMLLLLKIPGSGIPYTAVFLGSNLVHERGAAVHRELPSKSDCSEADAQGQMAQCTLIERQIWAVRVPACHSWLKFTGFDLWADRALQQGPGDTLGVFLSS